MFRRNDQLTRVVLYYVDEEYRSRHPCLTTEIARNESSLMRVLRIAETNGLLYPFCIKFLEESHSKEKSGLIKTKIREENKKIIRLVKTLNTIQDLFIEGNFDFMFIKLYRGIPYAPRDVDVLIKPEDVPGVVSLLSKNGFNVEAFNKVEIQCQREDLLKVDLYQGFYYLSLPFMDKEFLWANQRIANVCDVSCIVPTFEADFLSLVIHSLLGHRCLSLLDFLYAKNLLNSGCLNFDSMLRETEKYGWTNAFIRVSDTIRNIYEPLYSESNTLQPFDFPYIFSTKFVLEAFQGFADLPINSRRKFMFMLSAMLDAAYHRYVFARYIVPFEIPSRAKNFVMKKLYHVRKQRGDRKIG